MTIFKEFFQRAFAKFPITLLYFGVGPTVAVDNNENEMQWSDGSEVNFSNNNSVSWSN